MIMSESDTLWTAAGLNHSSLDRQAQGPCSEPGGGASPCLHRKAPAVPPGCWGGAMLSSHTSEPGKVQGSLMLLVRPTPPHIHPVLSVNC